MGKFSERLNDSYDNRKSGGSRKGALDFSKVDGEVKFYKLREGTNKIDIVPYIIKSKEHPLIKATKGKYKIGDMDYLLDIFVHKNVGPSEVSVICPKKTYGKACPLCEASDEYWKAGKKDESAALRASRRVFYNVIDATKPEEGLQILEQSHAFFEKELLEAAKEDSDKDGSGMIDFIDPDDGKTIKFKGSNETFAGKAYVKPKNFSFVDRENPISKYIKKAVSFDELISILSYDEIYALMNGVDDDDDDDNKIPEGRHPAKRGDDDDDDDLLEEKPPRSRKQEDNEDTVPPKVDETDKSPTCPHGHKFGKDNDKHDDCDDCKVWKDCARAAR